MGRDLHSEKGPTFGRTHLNMQVTRGEPGRLRPGCYEAAGNQPQRDWEESEKVRDEPGLRTVLYFWSKNPPATWMELSKWLQTLLLTVVERCNKCVLDQIRVGKKHWDNRQRRIINTMWGATAADGQEVSVTESIACLCLSGRNIYSLKLRQVFLDALAAVWCI